MIRGTKEEKKGEKTMKKTLSIMLVLLLTTSVFLFSGCQTKAEGTTTKAPDSTTVAATAATTVAATAATTAAATETTKTGKPLKIAFFVSDLSNVFHQAQFEAAKKYA